MGKWNCHVPSHTSNTLMSRTIAHLKYAHVGPALAQLLLEQLPIEEVPNEAEPQPDGVVAGIVSKEDRLHSPDEHVSDGATTGCQAHPGGYLVEE